MYATEVVCYEIGPWPHFPITITFLTCRTESFDNGAYKNLNLHGRQLNESIRRRIQDDDIGIICEYLTENPLIKNVELCYNNITNEGLFQICEFLKTNTSVEYLDLMMNDIEEDGIKYLADIGALLKLTSLRLNGNNFGRRGGMYLAELLQENKSLEYLDIAETDQTVTSFVHLMAALRYNENIKFLDISRVLGHYHYVLDIDHIIQVLSEMLSVNTTLTEIHLQKMEITDFVLKELMEALLTTNSLLLLDLSCNQIGDLGIDHIGNYLKTGPPLQGIMLNHNRIRNSGATFLSQAIAFSRVQFLDLAHNNIGEEGVLSLLHTVRKTHNLLVLFLFGNSVTGKALLLLELWLKMNVLQQSALDVIVYRDQFDTLQTAYNSQADMYKQEYYSVVGTLKRRRKSPSIGPNDLAFKYHNIVHKWDIPRNVFQ